MNQISDAFDAVVIGAGVSGLAAAITLAESGARVIVFEKQPSVGGTSINFRGIFAAESEMLGRTEQAERQPRISRI